MNYKNLFYFDIETVSDFKNIDDLKQNDERGYELFIRKIKRKSTRFEDWKSPDHNDIYIKKSPLIPEFGKIVCITMGFFKNDDLKIKSIYNNNEKELIKETHSIFKKISNTTLSLCGYYIKGFDIPWLNKKFMKYDLEIPRILRTFNIKPWDMNIYDLSEIWKSNGTLENTSFDEMLYTLNIDSPKNDISGEDVNSIYWENEDLNRIKKYCENDVLACVKSSEKIMKLI